MKNMRMFHNNIKKGLISYARQCKPDCELFDIGVGRGGDMYKWSKCGIKKVVGYDIDNISIEEAKRRYTNSDFSNECDYSFHTFPNLDTAVNCLHLHANQFDIVSCQFAIHYFFKNNDFLMNMLKHVHTILKPRGRFIGTFMDAEQLEHLTTNFTQTFQNSTFLIHTPSKINTKNRTGNCVQVHLTNTLYFGECAVSIEYLVYKHYLEQACKEVGLRLVEFKSFNDHYNENYNTIHMNEDTLTCSFTYTSFIFEKI